MSNIIRKYKLHKHFGVSLTIDEQEIISFIIEWLNPLTPYRIITSDIIHFKNSNWTNVVEYDTVLNVLTINEVTALEFLTQKYLMLAIDIQKLIIYLLKEKIKNNK